MPSESDLSYERNIEEGIPSVGDKVRQSTGGEEGIIVSQVSGGGSGFGPNYVVAFKSGNSGTFNSQELHLIQRQSTEVTPQVREALLTSPAGDIPESRGMLFGSSEEQSIARQQLSGQYEREYYEQHPIKEKVVISEWNFQRPSALSIKDFDFSFSPAPGYQFQSGNILYQVTKTGDVIPVASQENAETIINILTNKPNENISSGGFSSVTGVAGLSTMTESIGYYTPIEGGIGISRIEKVNETLQKPTEKQILDLNPFESTVTTAYTLLSPRGFDLIYAGIFQKERVKEILSDVVLERKGSLERGVGDFATTTITNFLESPVGIVETTLLGSEGIGFIGSRALQYEKIANILTPKVIKTAEVGLLALYGGEKTLKITRDIQEGQNQELFKDIAKTGLELVGFKIGGKIAEREGFQLGYKKALKELPEGAREEFINIYKEISSLEKSKIEVSEINLQGAKRIPEQAHEPITSFIREKGDVLGGSIGTRTQIDLGDVRYAESDLDIYTKANPIQRANELASRIQAGGVERVSTVEGKVTIGGKKIAEFKDISQLQYNVGSVESPFKSYKSFVTKTPSGINVLKIGPQLKRKLVASVLEGRFEKDFPDLLKSLPRLEAYRGGKEFLLNLEKSGVVRSVQEGPLMSIEKDTLGITRFNKKEGTIDVGIEKSLPETKLSPKYIFGKQLGYGGKVIKEDVYSHEAFHVLRPDISEKQVLGLEALSSKKGFGEAYRYLSERNLINEELDTKQLISASLRTRKIQNEASLEKLPSGRMGKTEYPYSESPRGFNSLSPSQIGKSIKNVNSPYISTRSPFKKDILYPNNYQGINKYPITKTTTPYPIQKRTDYQNSPIEKPTIITYTSVPRSTTNPYPINQNPIKINSLPYTANIRSFTSIVRQTKKDYIFYKKYEKNRKGNIQEIANKKFIKPLASPEALLSGTGKIRIRI